MADGGRQMAQPDAGSLKPDSEENICESRLEKIVVSASSFGCASGSRAANERPRLTVFRSLAHIYVQVIDDMTGKTVASAATTEAALKSGLNGKTRGGNKAGAEFIGQTIAQRLKEKGIKQGRVRPQWLPLSRPDSGSG